LCEAAEVLGDKALLHKVEEVAVRMAEATLKEGLSPDGGLCYEGKNGKIVDAGKDWWPQAEAVVGFINAYQVSRETKYLQAAKRVWDYTEQHIVDRVHGDWFWRITADGKVDAAKPKLSEWKCPYHSGRACLEAARRLSSLTACGKRSRCPSGVLRNRACILNLTRRVAVWRYGFFAAFNSR